MRNLDPITLTSGVSSTVTLDPGTIGILIANESPLAIAVGLGGYATWLPAWTLNYYTIPGMVRANSKITLTPTSISTASNSPSSTALVTIYTQGDQVEGQYPCSLTRQTNIGNGAIPTTATNSVVNDGNSIPTTVVEATPLGASSSELLLKNDGTGLLGAGLITIDNTGKVKQTTASNGAQIDSGMLLSVPTANLTSGALPSGVTIGATQLTNGALPAGVTLGAAQLTSGVIPSAITQWGSSAGGQQVSIGALNGTTQSGVMDQSNDGALYFKNNVILGSNNVLSGSNDLFITANPASQVILGGAALGSSQPILAYRVNTNTPSAGATVTWSAFRPIPIMVDSGGIGSSGYHIYTGTGTPSGAINGDLWFNG